VPPFEGGAAAEEITLVGIQWPELQRLQLRFFAPILLEYGDAIELRLFFVSADGADPVSGTASLADEGRMLVIVSDQPLRPGHYRLEIGSEGLAIEFEIPPSALP